MGLIVPCKFLHDEPLPDPRLRALRRFDLQAGEGGCADAPDINLQGILGGTLNRDSDFYRND